MILTVLVIVVDWCAHLFWCLGPLLGSLEGPCRGPGGPQISQNSVSCFDYHQFSKKKLNKAQSCLNIIEHIQGDMLKPFRPLERATGGCQKHPKMAIFEPKIAVFGHFWSSLVTLFWGPKGPNWLPWMCLTMFNHVQPCSTNVQPILARWDRLWPNMAILGKKWLFSGGSGAPMWHFRVV